MPEITTTKKENLSLGSRDAVVAAAAGIDNGDFFTSGLSAIDHVSISNGASGITVGYTVSGGVVTFVLSGSLTNPTILVIGFK